jgi:hypothetical protein
MKLNIEETEIVLNYLIRLKDYLKSEESFDLNNKWYLSDVVELEKFISKIQNRHVEYIPPISIVWKGF